MGTESGHILVLIRHAKSSWDEPLEDHDRPLAPRGRRQAPAIGTWLGQQPAPFVPGLVVVSTAARAQQTWARIASALPDGDLPRPRVESSAAAYTFSAADLQATIATFDPGVRTAAVVGHNPAVEDLACQLTGRYVSMPTSAVAVIAMADWAADRGQLLTAGRPADGDIADLDRTGDS